MTESTAMLGLLLLVLGLAMIIAEIFLPTVGVLGLAGIVSVIAGSLVLHHADVPGTDLLLPIVAGLATVGGLIVVGTAWFARMSMRQRVITGEQGMIGATAEAVDSFSEKGNVRYGGELWKAHTSAPVTAGQAVRIVKIEGLLLWVEPS